MRILVPMVIAIALLGSARAASAQRAAKAIQTLTTSTNEKVKMAALAEIATAGDPRAIPACIRALEKDSDKRVRALAAHVLEKLVTATSSAADLSRVKAALSRSLRSDPERVVRKQAMRASKKVQAKTRASAVPAGVPPAATQPVPSGTAGTSTTP